MAHDLLADDEKQLFARLSVFAGGSTLGAAEEIVEAELDGLHSLVDKSLVRRTGERFWMLETIRQFAASASPPRPTPTRSAAATRSGSSRSPKRPSRS